MKVLNYLDITHDPCLGRFNEVIDWVMALDAFDYGDPIPLSDIRGKEDIPPELMQVIMNIDQGERKPNLKAAAKLKIPAKDRLGVAVGVSIQLGLMERFKSGRKIVAYDEFEQSDRVINILADKQAIEPIDIVRSFEVMAREFIEEAAVENDVSIETIENLLRDLRRKFRDWPNI